MFDINWSRDKLICTMSETPDGHKLIEPTTMSCEVVLNLGTVPSTAAAKSLALGMDKTLNAMVKRKSGKFLEGLRNKAKAIGVVIEKHGDFAKSSDFLKKEEAELMTLWKNWSEKLAPKLAEEALQEVVKASRDKDVSDLNTKKVKTVGRVVAVPALSLAAAAASLVTGNVAGASSAALKAASAMMKASDELSKAMNTYKVDQDAVEKDINELAGALKTIAGRITSMDKRRKAAEMEIASLKSQQRVLAQELVAAKDMPGPERNKIVKLLKSYDDSVKQLAEGLPDTGDLKESWKKVATEHKKMLDAVKSTSSDTPSSLRTIRDLTDGSKEVLSILSKL